MLLSILYAMGLGGIKESGIVDGLLLLPLSSLNLSETVVRCFFELQDTCGNMSLSGTSM